MPTTATLIDLGFVVLVVLAAVSGWRRGGAVLALHGVGVVVGLVLGLRTANALSGSLGPVAHVLLGVGCALGGLLLGGALGSMVGRRVSSGMTRIHLGALDRILGAAARAAFAALLCWIALAAVVALGPAGWAAPIRLSSIANPSRVPVVSGIERAVRGAAPSDVAALVPSSDVHEPTPATVARIDRTVSGAVFKVEASGCQGAITGTGFAVTDPAGGEWAVTNAHVVRGAKEITLDTGHGPVTARAVVVDRGADLAVLDASELDVSTVPLADADASNGTPAVIVGYPHGGPRRAVPAVVEQRLPLTDPGMSDGLVLHEAYRLDADVEHGNSGSPLLTTDGRVVGVVNAAAVHRADDGFAVTGGELHDVLSQAAGSTGASTGTCST